MSSLTLSTWRDINKLYKFTCSSTGAIKFLIKDRGGSLVVSVLAFYSAIRVQFTLKSINFL